MAIDPLNLNPETYKRPSLSVLHKISGQSAMDKFLKIHEHHSGTEFIDELFSYFKFSTTVGENQLQRIPSEGALVIIANHPTSSLDGLALLSIISKVRGDIKLVADKALMHFNPLQPFLIPRKTKKTQRQQAIHEALRKGEVVIWFPAGDTSRISTSGIKDGRWSAEFLKLAKKHNTPVLPVLLEARSSWLSYISSFLFKPFRYFVMTRELLYKGTNNISFTIGNLIPHQKLISHQLENRNLVKRLKKHLYQLKTNENVEFINQKPIAKAEKTKHILADLQKATVLGKTRDNQTIYLADYHKGSALIKEIGRLREYTFRKVGEGTGSSRDLDKFDKYYRHLVLWHDKKQEIVGAYRLGECNKLINNKGLSGIYTSSLYQFSDKMIPFLEQSLEMGRSFVHPNYWGKASLDYLWQGIGAFLRHNPDIRYLIGPVSISAEFPESLINELVFYFQYFFNGPTDLVSAHHPYHVPLQDKHRLESLYQSLTPENGMELLQRNFKSHGYKIPILYKQYTSIFEKGGFQILAFSIDHDFGDCIDGLLMTDISKLKPKKRDRYIGNID